MIKDPTCKNKNWKMTELEEIVFNEIKKLAMYPDYINKIKTDKAIKADTPNKIEVIEKEITKLDDQISRFMDLYGIGKFTIDQVSQKVEPLNESRNSLLKELEALNAESGRLSVEEAREIIESFSEILDGGDFEEIRTVIEMLIYYIEIDNDIVRIHWKFA
jgi:site-specific DNA recombinase